MASAKREPITGVWGLCPQRGPGAEPLVEGSGGEGPLKLNAFFCVVICLKRRKSAMFMSCFKVIQCDRAMSTASASICVTWQVSFNFFIHGLGGGAWPLGPSLPSAPEVAESTF